MKKGDKLHIRKVLFISKLALVLVLVYVVVRIALLPERIENNLMPAPASGGDGVYASEIIDPPVLSLNDYSEIIENNPFGTSGQVTADSTGFEQLASEELGLALLGTVSGSPTVARAIIKDLKTGVLDLYKIGQEIADAHIESIDTDTVILMHKGEKKILKLNTAKSGSKKNNTQEPSSQNVNDSGAAGDDLSSRGNDTNIATKTGFVEAILNNAVVEPYVVNGQVEGLRITGLENIDVAKDIGLKDGDIIRIVNGHRLTSKQKAYQVFKKAKSQRAISLELLRGNETKNLSFSLR